MAGKPPGTATRLTTGMVNKLKPINKMFLLQSLI